MDGPREPIIILGAARSGTALLNYSIASHPDVAGLDEPNFVWKAYNAGVGHDMLPPSLATERVKRYVRRRFAEHVRRAGRTRLCEKTPQSALRLPFVLEIFPDAKLVHVIRDGREVVASARAASTAGVEKITSTRETGPGPRRGSLKNARRLVGVIGDKLHEGFPLRDLPYYGPKLWHMALGLLGVKERFAWGPEFPGMRRMVRTHPMVDVCALQWQLCVEGVLNTLAHRRDVPCYEVRFERLVTEREAVAREVFDFAGLPQPDSLRPLPPQRFVYDPSANRFEKDLTPAEQAIVLDRIAGTLRTLGYLA